MTKDEFERVFFYYESIERDIDNTSKYIEPRNQENAFSHEFCKIIILSCTELESVMKILCKELTGKECGNIGEYKACILNAFPNIGDAVVMVPRFGKDICPFKEWESGKLSWWDSYTHLKHSYESYSTEGTYKNAVYALSALYILILYLAKHENIDFRYKRIGYLDSDYELNYLIDNPEKSLP